MSALLALFTSGGFLKVVGIVTAGIGFIVAIFFTGKSAGKSAAELKNAKEREDARARMDAIKPSSGNDTVDRLRSGEF